MTFRDKQVSFLLAAAPDRFTQPALAALCPTLKTNPKVRLKVKLGEPRLVRSLDPTAMKKLIQKRNYPGLIGPSVCMWGIVAVRTAALSSSLPDDFQG